MSKVLTRTSRLFRTLLNWLKLPLKNENRKLSYRRDSARRRSLRVEVTDFGTNRNPVYDILLSDLTGILACTVFQLSRRFCSQLVS